MSAARRSAWARLRADLRLARRQVWRTKGSSALVMLLVALPVAGLAGAAVTVQSHIPTPQQRAELELGHAQAWLAVAGGPDPSRTQNPAEPWDNTVARDEAGNPLHPAEPAPADPSAALPAGTRTIELLDQGVVFVKTATGIGQVSATVGPAWDPVFAGRFSIIQGDAPTTADGAMASPGMLRRLGAAVGDRVTLADSGRSYLITGTMRRMDLPASEDQLFLPDSARDQVSGMAQWYTPDWQPTATELSRLNHAGFIVYGRDLAVHARQAEGDSSRAWTILMVGAIVAVFCGYLVVLQGTVLGTLGGMVGAAAGVGLAALFLRVTDNGAVGTFWGAWGLHVPWWLLAGIVVFAVAVGTIAALVPARTATRGDVLGALRGARRPARLNPKRPLWGLLLMILGLAGTVAGGLGIAALNLQKPIDYGDPLRTIALWAVVLAPIVFQIGILFAGHWVLAGIARVASRLGMAPRLASRDAAASPSRVIPAFAAIAVCVFLASFVLSATAATSAASARNYSWTGPLGSVQVSAWSSGETDAARTLHAIDGLLAPTRPEATVVEQMPPDPPSDPTTGAPQDPDFPVWSAADRCPDCGQAVMQSSGTISVVDPDGLEALLDTRIPAATLAAVRDGAVLEVTPWGSYVDNGRAQLARWTSSTYSAYSSQVQEVYAGTRSASDLPKPEQVVDLPGVKLDLAHPQGMLQLIIAPDTAKRIGMTVVPRAVVAVYPEPVSTQTLDSLTAAAANIRVGENGTLDVRAERGPDSADLWLWLILAVAGALVIGASAVSLGLARFERRPDDATLAAVGAGRGVRRWINAWQAVIIAGIGTVVGTVAGLIPMWGIAQSSTDYLRFDDVPWAWLAILAVGLPAVVAVVSWLVPPRRPELTRRTAIA